MPAIGAPCVGLGQCGPGAGCNGFSPMSQDKGVCVKLGAENEACPCAYDLACAKGKCIPFGPAVCQ